MIVILSSLIGAALGWLRATKLDGNRADHVQYAFGFGLAFSIIGLILTVIVSRYI
ncbi:hypothetical protein [Paracoccus aminophilus]|uniref:Uncharacterized protein n=1 Tax=Paracoccus aminophilus JCM 7686 TaxID=1367847 RepID=S5XUT6_PARAH|nr:hypothetical protein [Paracoccus aminophilus]AGT08987.1 hypothetical protein JCM7686_1886 [Paracoccus aminophilus JCM 7686]